MRICDTFKASKAYSDNDGKSWAPHVCLFIYTDLLVWKPVLCHWPFTWFLWNRDCLSGEHRGASVCSGSLFMMSYLEVGWGVVVLRRLLETWLWEDAKGPYSSSNPLFSEISVPFLSCSQFQVFLLPEVSSLYAFKRRRSY